MVRSVKRSRSFAWLVASVMTVIALMAMAALILTLPLKTYEPYLIAVDRSTGFLEVKRPLAEGPLSQDESVTMFNVVRFIRARETYDPKALKDNFDLAQLLATGDAARELTELYSPANPGNPIRQLGLNTIVAVTIKSVTFPNYRTALVRFATEEKSSAKIETRHYVGLVRFRYAGAPMRNEFRFENPARLPGHGIPPRPRDRADAARRPAAILITCDASFDQWTGGRMRRLMLTLAFITATDPALAESTPRAGPLDPRVRQVRFQKDQVVAIDATFGISTMVVFGDGEKIESIAVGDSVAWRVEPNKRGNIIFLKPVEPNAATNMNVVTDKRLYAFVLRSNERPSRAQVYKIRFRYPDDEADARLLNQAREVPNCRTTATSAATGSIGPTLTRAQRPRGRWWSSMTGSRPGSGSLAKCPPSSSSTPSATRA